MRETGTKPWLTRSTAKSRASSSQVLLQPAAQCAAAARFVARLIHHTFMITMFAFCHNVIVIAMIAIANLGIARGIAMHLSNLSDLIRHMALSMY